MGKTLQTATLEGSVAHSQYEALQRKFQPVYDKLQVIKDKQNLIQDKKSPEYEALSLELREGFQDMRPVEEAFIRANPKSWVSWNIMADKSMIVDPTFYKELSGLFGPKFTSTADGERLKENIEIAIATQIGQPAPLFAQADTEGKQLALKSLRGKYVLIDFWASWCGPCRVENPFVVEAYNQFKDKNFEILGVSLDDKKDAWLKAIKEDKLPWLHVSDLKGWKNDVAVQYYIGAVPQNLLLDPNGVYYGLALLLLGLIQGALFFFTGVDLGQNEYSNIARLAMGVHYYLPLFGSVCMFCGTWLLVSIRD